MKSVVLILLMTMLGCAPTKECRFTIGQRVKTTLTGQEGQVLNVLSRTCRYQVRLAPLSQVILFQQYELEAGDLSY